MSTTPARDALRKYVNLLADSWTPRERTDERVEWLYSLVRAEVLRTFTQTEARAEADRHRAAVLRGAADHIEVTCPTRSETFPKPCVHCSGPADRLRRLAENVEDGEDTFTVRSALDRVRALHAYDADADYCVVCSNHGDIQWPCRTVAVLEEQADKAGKDTATGGESTRAAELTVYRAQHDSIVMGLYTTAAAARAHCEAAEWRAWPTGTRLTFDWIEDEDDGVAEMVVFAGQNEESLTGYIVESLTAQATYDEEADE